VPGDTGTDQLLVSGVRRLDITPLDFEALADEIAWLPFPDEPASSPHQAALW